jgi:hypothetical protein
MPGLIDDRLGLPSSYRLSAEPGSWSRCHHNMFLILGTSAVPGNGWHTWRTRNNRKAISPRPTAIAAETHLCQLPSPTWSLCQTASARLPVPDCQCQTASATLLLPVRVTVAVVDSLACAAPQDDTNSLELGYMAYIQAYYDRTIHCTSQWLRLIRDFLGDFPT